MKYTAKLIYRDTEVLAIGDTEQQAIDKALADNGTVRNASNPHDVALVMFHEYDNARHVSYATTLGKYRIDTE